MAAAGAALAACGTSTQKPTAQTTQSIPATYTLVWRPWYNFSNATSKTGHALLMQGIQPWLQKNPGIAVNITYLGYQGTTVAALLAGNGPDVFADWVLPDFLEGKLLLDMTKYVRQSNTDLSIFPKLEMELFQQEGGLWALPSYLHLEAPAVNLDVLDQLGLKYPQTGWTWKEWGQLYKETAVKSTTASKRRMGGEFYWSGYDYHGNNPHAFYLKGFGGEYVDPADNMKGYLTAPGTVAAFDWIYGLMQAGVCNGGGSNFATGQIACGHADTAGGLIGAAENWRSLKWQVYDTPIWPQGKVAYAASDFYGISAAAKRPDICWSFMQYLCVEETWQRWMMQLAMNGPNQTRLYPEWVSRLKSIAPPLANVDLDVFNRQMQGDMPYFGLTYKYQDAQTANAINAATGPALNQKVDLPTALQQAEQQVNKIETAGALLATQSVAASKVFPVVGNDIAPMPTGV